MIFNVAICASTLLNEDLAPGLNASSCLVIFSYIQCSCWNHDARVSINVSFKLILVNLFIDACTLIFKGTKF